MRCSGEKYSNPLGESLSILEVLKTGKPQVTMVLSILVVMVIHDDWMRQGGTRMTLDTSNMMMYPLVNIQKAIENCHYS
jgi:hypothetical protein